MVVVAVAVFISLVAAPTNNGMELLAVGVQLIRRAPDNAGTSLSSSAKVAMIVVVAAVSTQPIQPFPH